MHQPCNSSQEYNFHLLGVPKSAPFLSARTNDFHGIKQNARHGILLCFALVMKKASVTVF